MKPYAVAQAHQKGGAGKTTTTINLAVKLMDKYPVTVLDLDPQKQTTKFNQSRAEKNLPTFNMVEINNEDDLLNQLQKPELTLIDLGGYDSELSRTALLYTDLVVTPLSDSDLELDGLLEFKKIMDKIIEQQKEIECKILVTRIHHNDTNTRKALVEFTDGLDNFSVFETVIPTNVKYKNPISTGKAIFEKTSGTPAIIFNKFAQEVIEKIEQGQN